MSDRPRRRASGELAAPQRVCGAVDAGELVVRCTECGALRGAGKPHGYDPAVRACEDCGRSVRVTVVAASFRCSTCAAPR